MFFRKCPKILLNPVGVYHHLFGTLSRRPWESTDVPLASSVCDSTYGPRPLGLAIPTYPTSPANRICTRVTPSHPARQPASSGHIDGATVPRRHGRRTIHSGRNHFWAHKRATISGHMGHVDLALRAIRPEIGALATF